MSNLRKAASEALQLLESTISGGANRRDITAVITELKEALEQPPQEPYAWVLVGGIPFKRNYFITDREEMEFSAKMGRKITPLYTSPSNVRRLSDSEIEDVRNLLSKHLCYNVSELTMVDVINTVQDKLNIPKEGER